MFRHLRDVEHLPQHFPRMTSAEPTGKDEVDVTARVGGPEIQDGLEKTLGRVRGRIEAAEG